MQPYVENAIWHGLMHLPDRQAGKKGMGHLEIELYVDGNILFCKITDNGIGRKQAAAIAGKSATKHKSMGLRITAGRIAMLQNKNGNESPVSISDLVNPDESAGGTEVIIKMPVIHQ